MENQTKKMPVWDDKESYTYDEIKAFYSKLMGFPKEILEQIIFYGGTVGYIITGAEKAGRKFGDVDLLVQADKIDSVRKYLKNIDDFFVQFDGKQVAEDYNIISTDGIQDFGFKGWLFGVKISVSPIAETKDGLVISKWLKVRNNKVDLIANTIMLQNSNLTEMIEEIECEIGSLNVIRTELAIIWKKRRMNLQDEQDIKFMYENEKRLAIKAENIKMLSAKTPYYEVSKAYKITSKGINELGRAKYEDY